LALTALTAVCLYHRAPAQALDWFQAAGQTQNIEAIDTVKTAHLALKTQTSSLGFSHFGDLSGELLSLGLGVRFRAPGTSMHPTIRHGDLITVEPVAPTNLKRGDIILYRIQSGLIAHRIVNIERRNGCGRTLILRGDASVSDDAPVKPEQVLGKVVCLKRNQRIIDPYCWRVRLWSMFYLWLARCRRVVIQYFLSESAPRVLGTKH
jgi:signal peptidase